MSPDVRWFVFCSLESCLSNSSLSGVTFAGHWWHCSRAVYKRWNISWKYRFAPFLKNLKCIASLGLYYCIMAVTRLSSSCSVRHFIYSFLLFGCKRQTLAGASWSTRGMWLDLGNELGFENGKLLGIQVDFLSMFLICLTLHICLFFLS